MVVSLLFGYSCDRNGSVISLPSQSNQRNSLVEFEKKSERGLRSTLWTLVQFGHQHEQPIIGMGSGSAEVFQFSSAVKPTHMFSGLHEKGSQ